MPYEDTNKSYIELLISTKRWQEAYASLRAYIDANGKDYWASNYLKLVEDNLKNQKENKSSKK